MLDRIRSLYDYSAWANARVLGAADRVTVAQFQEPLPGAGSLRDILVHIAEAQWVWLKRWQGASPGDLWDEADFPDVATLRRRWDNVNAETGAFITGLREDELDRIVAYTNRHGEPWNYPLWDALLHQANHATQHRSEAAVLLTRFGHSPGDLDYLIYIDDIRRRV